ncbi:hypothetical protein [Mycobacterium paragordonae]|uniref:hypothetical protein n=1 Tax=Mycobacterium paragordonae TaxID=1389713 RepID=UPI0012E1B449|nr:hypothetical protein [Mycobacterium paragordonae]
MPAVTLGIWIIKILAMTHPKAGELGDGRADIRQFGTWRVGVRGGPSVGVALYSGPALAGHLGHLVQGGVHLTRPLGATVGDFLETPVGGGGLAFSRPLATTEIGAVMVALIIVMLQRRGRHPETSSASTT